MKATFIAKVDIQYYMHNILALNVRMSQNSRDKVIQMN